MQIRGTIARLIIASLFAALPGISVAQTEPAATTPSAAPMSADDLPNAALQGDLLGVAVFDLKTGDKTAWNNAWVVMTGGKPTTRPLGPDDPLPIGLDQAIGPIFKMGADRFVYSVSIRNGSADLTLGFRLPAGTSENAASAWLRKTIPGTTPFEHDGAWLIKRINQQSGGKPPVLPLNPHADDVRQELNCWGDDVPVKIVYLTSDSLKKQMMRGGPPPAEIAAMANLYWSARYFYVGVKLGEHPQVEARWVAPDAGGADAVIKEFVATAQKLKQPGNAIGIPVFFGAALGQCKPVREDNIVRVSLGQKELSNIFAIVVAGSMAQNQNQQNGGQQFAQQTPVAADWAPTDPAIDSASAQMRLILSAIAEYDREHQSLPAALSDLVSDKLLPGAEIFHDPRTGKDDGFIYVKPEGATKLSDISGPAKTGILFEEKDGNADPAGLVGYADGHVGMGK
jgi:hypothetical protein